MWVLHAAQPHELPHSGQSLCLLNEPQVSPACHGLSSFPAPLLLPTTLWVMATSWDSRQGAPSFPQGIAGICFPSALHKGCHLPALWHGAVCAQPGMMLNSLLLLDCITASCLQQFAMRHRPGGTAGCSARWVSSWELQRCLPSKGQHMEKPWGC